MKQRMITAMGLILIGLPILIYGRLPFLFLGVTLSLIAVKEMLQLIESQTTLPIESKCLVYVGTLVILLNGLDVTSWTYSPTFKSDFKPIIGLIFLLLILFVFKKGLSLKTIGHQLFTMLYVGLTFHSLLVIRLTDLKLLIFLALILIATDSGAYFMGRAFGKRKLAPTISPNKTLEGSIGGTIIGVVAGVGFASFSGIDGSIISLTLLSLFLAIVGQFGDLIASKMKRESGIKDFGTIFPGHGGVLDRFDSHLFAALMLYFVLV